MRPRTAGALAARAAAMAVILALLLYSLPRFEGSVKEAPTYDLVDEFKGGNTVGFRYAYVGAWLLVTSQAYVILKSFVMGLRLRIRLARWMSLHCVLNTTGFALVLIHAGFPYSFRYWNPFTGLDPFVGLEGLAGVRGLLTWLVLILFSSGMLARYSRNSKFRDLMRRIHSYTVAPAFVFAAVHIFISITLPT